MKNNSGLKPLDLKVIIDLGETKDKTSGGIALPEEMLERERFAKTEGIIVSIGSNAFKEWTINYYQRMKAGGKDVKYKEIEKELPKVGDKVIIGKYTGQYHKGSDGHDYRIVNDIDIWAIKEE